MTTPSRIRNYNDFVTALRTRADDLGATREQLDEVAGLASGYAAKLLAPGQPRKFGWKSFDAMLGALGLALIAVDDPEALAKLRGRYHRKRRATGPV